MISLREKFKELTAAELKAIRKVVLGIFGFGFPGLFFIFVFFVLDVHAFNDIALRTASANKPSVISSQFVKLFILLGADVHANNDQALQMAAWEDNNDAIETLLNHGADIHVKNDVVLFSAIKSGDSQTVKLILDKSNFSPDCGKTWLAKRTIWLRTANAENKPEITNMIESKVKLPSVCSGRPSKDLLNDAKTNYEAFPDGAE